MDRKWIVRAACVVNAACVVFAGCNSITGLSGGDSPASDVAAKAVRVADQIGGAGGFGGTMMTGYRNHVGAQMGFLDADDLALMGQNMMIRLENDSAAICTFHLTYVSSVLGLEEQGEDIDVDPGETADVEIPCAEIVGLGPLEIPGAPGCQQAVTGDIPNTFSMPGFLNLDFACGERFGFTLTPDSDDLDEDGDTEELVLLSDGLVMHLRDGGPLFHSHRGGMMHGGMMFP